MNSRRKARAAATRAPLLALIVVALGAALWAAGQRRTPASAAELLSGSEISVTESGGIAGRVHSVRLSATSGRVDVEYRAREGPPAAAPFTGSLPTDRYIALWREFETAGIWEALPAKPTPGADMIQTEIRIRLGDASRVVRWDDGATLTPQLQGLAAIARRALAAGRESAFAR